MDAPRHSKLRKLVSAAFTPRQIRRIEDGISESAQRIVAEAVERGGGNFVELVAKRLPLETISKMIGVPDADRERIVNAADTLVTAVDPDVLQGRSLPEVIGGAIFTLHQFAGQLAQDRSLNPQDDLMTALVQAEVEGEKLTQAEISAFFVLLSVAGNDTTRHSTSQALHALTNNPDQRALLAGEIEGRLPIAVEEFIRWATPVSFFRRTTTQPTEMHGITIPENEKVVMLYISGNRDDSVFSDPWSFDITREPNRHVGFGGGGPHFCLGASLARTQLRMVFHEIFTQMPNFTSGERVMYKSGPLIQGVKHLEFSVN